MLSIGRRAAGRLRRVLHPVQVPAAAKSEQRADRAGLSANDPGTHRVIEEGVAWLCRAQDCSRSSDGGVARHYSLIDGWAASYPETTGYIIPTLIQYSDACDSAIVRHRARRMLDWLVSIQFQNGAFQGGTVDDQPRVPVAFNTGQILLGLAAGARAFGNYEQSLIRAADWLVAAQDRDGCWRRHSSPFAMPGEKTFDTHAAWGLLEAARVMNEQRYAEAALANVRWALSFQRENGWFDHCCLSDATQPLTHTLGYALRGVIEAYVFSGDAAFLEASLRTADGLLSARGSDGFLPGRLDARWRPTVRWACLTGSAQVAICWFLLYRLTGESKYLQAGRAVNRYLRRTFKSDGPAETRGGIKGSFPISGEYGTYEYLNWACKFFVDANALEREIQTS